MHCDLFIGEKIEMEGRRIGEGKEVQILGSLSDFADRASRVAPWLSNRVSFSFPFVLSRSAYARAFASERVLGDDFCSYQRFNYVWVALAMEHVESLLLAI